MSDKAKIWYFEDVDLFEILCPRKSPGLENKHNPNLYKRDDYIYFPEENSQNIYMIADGRVKIGSYLKDGKEIIKSILGKRRDIWRVDFGWRR